MLQGGAMPKSIVYLTLRVPAISTPRLKPVVSSLLRPRGWYSPLWPLPYLSVCSYPVGCILDLSDHSL